MFFVVHYGYASSCFTLSTFRMINHWINVEICRNPPGRWLKESGLPVGDDFPMNQRPTNRSAAWRLATGAGWMTSWLTLGKRYVSRSMGEFLAGCFSYICIGYPSCNWSVWLTDRLFVLRFNQIKVGVLAVIVYAGSYHANAGLV